MSNYPKRKRRASPTDPDSLIKKPKQSLQICLICSKANYTGTKHYCNCKTGILNMGNSCYINAALQALAELEIPLELPPDSLFLAAYNKLREFSPDSLSLVSVLPEISDVWEHYSKQEDAHEFFTALLALCDSSRFSFEMSSRIICTNCEDSSSDFLRKDNTFHMVIDESSLQTQINETSEIIEVDCATCGYSKHILYKKVEKVEDVFIVKMNRFQFNPKTCRAAKIRTKSELPSEVKIGEESLQLNTVIMHKGKAVTHGHYVTYMHSKEILIDDDKVIYGQQFNLDYSYFYIAFYRKCS